MFNLISQKTASMVKVGGLFREIKNLFSKTPIKATTSEMSLPQVLDDVYGYNNLDQRDKNYIASHFGFNHIGAESKVTPSIYTPETQKKIREEIGHPYGSGYDPKKEKEFSNRLNDIVGSAVGVERDKFLNQLNNQSFHNDQINQLKNIYKNKIDAENKLTEFRKANPITNYFSRNDLPNEIKETYIRLDDNLNNHNSNYLNYIASLLKK